MQPERDRQRAPFADRTLLVLAVALCAGLSPPGQVRAQQRLFEQEPYDRITLDKNNGGLVLKVEPLKFPNRRVPEKPPLRGVLEIRPIDEPESLYEVQWHMIDKLELFEGMVLDEANKLVSAGKLEEAYDYFNFLEQNHPNTLGLDASMENYLYEEAKAAHLEGEFAAALAMLRELYRRNPKRPGLDKALGVSTDKLVEQYLARNDYRSARQLIENLKAWFPEQAVVANRETQLEQQAAALLAKARSHVQDGNYAQADRVVRELKRVWPRLPGGEDFARSLHEKYPRLVIGVSAPAVAWQPGGMNDWAARRSSRLIYRTLTEFVRPGTEGGEYVCPVGKLTFEELDRRLTLQIDAGIGWSSGNAVLTGYDVSRRLLAMASPGDPAYRPEWAELLGSVSVSDVYQVDADLRGPHVRPEPLLQTVLIPYTTPTTTAGPPPSNGPYVVDSRTDNEVIYRADPRYFARGPSQPMEIVERHFPEGVEAIRALRLGQIRAVDRVNPWNLPSVRADCRNAAKNLVVQPYGMPLVHCLIPNMRKPLPAHRAFRRALVYGIHRQAILDHLIRNTELPGSQVISGPFLFGLSIDEGDVGFASDRSIQPRMYEPRLAIALAGVAFDQVARSLKKQGQQLEPGLVLAHGDDEIARVACGSIKRQLELIKIPIELRQLEGPAPSQIPADVDLLYAELSIWEPLIDARRLLGKNGMSAGCSPYMSLALRRLERATDWQQVHDSLLAIHRIAHDDVAVVPLWQLTDHFAYHVSLGGVGAKPVSLYQNIEQWKAAFKYGGE